MRRDLHSDRAIPALYIATDGATPIPCTVRVHDKFEGVGAPAGGSISGFAQVQNDTPRIIFIVDDAPAFIRNGAVVSVEAGEAYRIDNTQPPHDITITAVVTRLPADEAVGLPVPA